MRIASSSHNLSLVDSGQSFSSSSLLLDGLQNQFSNEACNATNLLAMTVGGLAFKLSRLAVSASLSSLPLLPKAPLANVLGLFSEVVAFRAISHSLSENRESVADTQGFWRDFTHFGTIKGVGHFLQSQNFFFRHISQNLGMILGEEAGALLHLNPQNQSSFSERFVQASATTLALEAGSGLAHFIGAHRVRSLENQWEARFQREARSRIPVEASAPSLLRFSKNPQCTHPTEPHCAELIEKLLGEYSAAQFPHSRRDIFRRVNNFNNDFFEKLEMQPGLIEATLDHALLKNDSEHKIQIADFIAHYLMNPNNVVTARLEQGITRCLASVSPYEHSISRKFPQESLARRVRQGTLKAGSQEFWDAAGIQHFHFADAEGATCNLIEFLRLYYHRIPCQEKIKIKNSPTAGEDPALDEFKDTISDLVRSLFGLSAPREKSNPNSSDLFLSSTQLLERLGLSEKDARRRRGRSRVYQMKDQSRLLVIKEKEGVGFSHENNVQAAVLEAGLREYLPEPAHINGQRVHISDGKNRRYITHSAFFAHQRYFDYLDNTRLSWEDFKSGILKSAHDLGVLARHGLYQKEPLVLYHDRGSGQSNQRRYTSCPEFNTFQAIGMGVIDDYPKSLKHPNFSVPGLRDAESIHAMDHTYNNIPLSEAVFLGDNLLALTLLIGHRMAHEARRFDQREKMILGEENPWLRQYADLFLQTYAQLYAGRRNMSLEDAVSILRNRADWLRLARECAFFMTPTYKNYVRSDRSRRRRPQTEYTREQAFNILYGPRVQVQGMGPYRNDRTQKSIPYWPASDLGAANGAFPIIEFRRAWFATLWGKDMEEMRED